MSVLSATKKGKIIEFKFLKDNEKTKVSFKKK